jgi:hypothetical protein
MHRKLTITLSEAVHRGLHQEVGRGKISGFIQRRIRPHVVTDEDLEAGHGAAAAHEQEQREALDWIEACIDEGFPRPSEITEGHG